MFSHLRHSETSDLDVLRFHCLDVHLLPRFPAHQSLDTDFKKDAGGKFGKTSLLKSQVSRDWCARNLKVCMCALY